MDKPSYFQSPERIADLARFAELKSRIADDPIVEELRSRVAELEAQTTALTTPSAGAVEAYALALSARPENPMMPDWVMPRELKTIAAVERHARNEAITDAANIVSVWGKSITDRDSVEYKNGLQHWAEHLSDAIIGIM